MTFIKEQLTDTGLKIGREIKDRSGNSFIRLDSEKSNASVVVRDQKDGKYFIVKVYNRDEANRWMDKWEKSF